jgi:hypothetical protein
MKIFLGKVFAFGKYHFDILVISANLFLVPIAAAVKIALYL